MKKDKISNVIIIPRTVIPFEEGTQATDIEVKEGDLVFYEPSDGETVRVLLWERYPSYDIIFGVPDKTSPKYEKEIGFFTVRRAGHVSYSGFYFDIKESKAMVEGFGMILEMSKSHSPHLWKKHLS